MGKHPATFSKKVLQAIDGVIEKDLTLIGPRAKLTYLDPFAGTGKLFTLERPRVEMTCIDIDLGWDNTDPRVQLGNALRTGFRKNQFWGIITSPCYGNRMSDHHDAKDSCKTCMGEGKVMADDRTWGACKICGGSGLSKRNTYKHTLGRDPHEESSAILQWGPAYRSFHHKAWEEATRVARQRFVLNISNHIRQHEEQKVAEWHRDTLLAMGWSLTDEIPVKTPRLRHGENHEVRVAHEYVFVFDRAA